MGNDRKIEQVFKEINRIHPLSKEEELALIEIIKIQTFPQNKIIVKEGFISDKVYFLFNGAVRTFHCPDGIEKTIWFTFENNFITSFYSFISGNPSNVNIESIEACECMVIQKRDLFRLIEKYDSINTIYRKVLEQTIVDQEKYLQNDYGDAKERYSNLVSNFPHYIQRIPLNYIASFLGINQSTLSRIRKNV